jgi:hypothetical protein
MSVSVAAALTLNPPHIHAYTHTFIHTHMLHVVSFVTVYSLTTTTPTTTTSITTITTSITTLTTAAGGQALSE